MDYKNFEAKVQENASSEVKFSLSAQEDNFIDDSVDDQVPTFL